jgi:cytidylate kinase
MNNKIITIDGPSGVGKGTLARKIAEHFNYDILDSGSIYRLASLHCYLQNANLESESEVCNVLNSIYISFKATSTGLLLFLGDKEVTNDIRTEKIGMLTSKIASYPKVRQMLHDKMLSFASDKGLVADGRDMGTIVFPNAKYKFFLEASSEVRAHRRFDELTKKGQNPDFEIIKSDIEQRDYQDRNRKTAPLVAASDAILIDTSNLSVNGVFDYTLSHIK